MAVLIYYLVRSCQQGYLEVNILSVLYAEKCSCECTRH